MSALQCVNQESIICVYVDVYSTTEISWYFVFAIMGIYGLNYIIPVDSLNIPQDVKS